MNASSIAFSRRMHFVAILVFVACSFGAHNHSFGGTIARDHGDSTMTTESASAWDRKPVPAPDARWNDWQRIAAIVIGTFVSEDLTSVSAGLLIQSGEIDWTVGLAGCIAGIFVGDLGLWAIGRGIAAGCPQVAWLRRRWSNDELTSLIRWFYRRGFWAILASRFLPGTRLPLYLAAGMFGVRGDLFALWTAVAALIWTPIVVLGSAHVGASIAMPLTSTIGIGRLTTIVIAAILVIALRVIAIAATERGRARIVAGISRIWRWEFWPSWIFYLPVLPWLAYLSVRHRNPFAWTAANPAIPHGGVVGESKSSILSRLPAEWVIPFELLPEAEVAARIKQLEGLVAKRSFEFPLIFKPDAGERGAGVKCIRDLEQAREYLDCQPATTIVQTYHSGPFEAGILYYRHPDEPTGHIFSVTDKIFPVLVGDGVSTIEQLIWRHPRFRMQARTFLSRHENEVGRVLGSGEQFALGRAGNHCQGTMFRDGSHLITPALAERIDAIAKSFRGFFIGRFDVRYRDPADFMAGKDLAIVELNGVTSESTNIYDPSWSLLRAYRTLYLQWSLLYQIGAANGDRGEARVSAIELARLIVGHYRRPHVDLLAD